MQTILTDILCNLQRAYPELGINAHLFEQHVDCSGAFGNPPEPLRGEELDSPGDEEEQEEEEEEEHVQTPAGPISCSM